MGCHGFALLAFLWGACFISVARAFVPTPPALLRPSHQQVQSRHVQTGATSVSPVDATHPAVRSPRGGALRMGFGDILNKALANEDMGDRKIQNPGLKGDIKWCMVTVNGKTVKAVQGQSLREAVRVSGAKIEYGCEKGNCGTCESIVDGKKMRVCKAIVPRNKDKLSVKTKFG